MVEGVLCSSASRSAVVASGRPCGVLQGDPQVAPLLSVRLQDLLPKGQRQRRKYLLESEEESEETREQFAKAVAFWTSSRLTKQNQVAASALESEPPEYFISHVWQPPDQATSMHDYGEEKVNLLKHWAIRCKALMPDGDGRSLKTPWFLLENDEEQQMAMTDPMNSWRTMRCWVDKACAHRGFGLAGAPPQEALRATKVALCNCDQLVALISHPGYFHRLWCCVEWAFFLSRAAPKYRSLEILMPDALHQPAAWAELVHTAASFRVEDLRCTGDAFEHELRRELELLAVDLEGFEGFMRATSLALLTLHALLQQGEGCACFGSAAFVEAAVEACEACGLRGLGKVLATAQPMLWWRSAYRQVRRQYDERHHSGATEIGEIPGAGGNEGTLSDDPLEMLVRYVNKKWFREETTEVEPVDVATSRLAPEEGEEEELLEDDAVVEPSEDRPAADAATASMPLTLTSSLPLTLASLSETAELLLKQGITELPEAEAQEEEEVLLAVPPSCSPREAASYALRACEASKEKTLRAQKLEEGFMEDMATFTVNFKRKVKEVADVADVAKTSSANAGVAETGAEEGPRDELRGEVESTAWKKILARSGAGLPDGYFDFWDAVQGEKLAPEAKVKARLFFQSWAIYERRVCKWFDAYVVPFLEVWRQRGIRTKGVIEEAFAESFLRVGGSIHDDLSQQLSQKESSGGETKIHPRLMGYRHAESWENPCLERLLAIPRKEVTFVEGAGQDRSMLPCIVSSSLPLQLGQEPKSAVLCARPVDGQWRRACVAQKLGATGLSNGVYQLLTNFTSKGTSDGVDLEVILPRLLLQVRGAGCEVVCGMRVKGFLEEKEEGPLERSGHSWFHARTLAPEEISGTSEEKISGSASSAVAETQDENYIDWSPWKLRAPAEADVDTTGGGHISPPAPKLGKGPRAVIDLQLEHGVVGAGLRPRKWWKEPTGAAERLLPKGVETLPQKLPLISQQRFWHPKTDRERGLKRAWRQLSAKPELPWTVDLAKAQANFDPFDELPKSARVKMLKNQDCYKLKDSRWLWRCMVEGGPKRADEAPRLEERFGSLPEHFDRLYQELQSTCFAEWVTLGPCTESQERPMKTGDYAGGGGALLPPPAVTGMTGGMMSPSQAEEGGLAPNPLDASSPCERCHQRALAKVPLKGSMLAIIWDAEVCFVCLRCGWASTDATGQRAELLEGEKILEVATTFLLRPGDGDMLQRSVARVLRVESNCCSVAVVQAKGRAESRVATMSFALSTVTTAAAATVVKRNSRGTSLEEREERSRPFASDQNWITNGLADTGLDLHFDKMRIYSVELAIQELDDKRMLRLRQEVSPIVMWLEVVYLLSPQFSLIRWNRALAEVFGTVTLTAAVLMRMNINRLREVVGAGPIPMEEGDDVDQGPVTSPATFWPVKLHRVVVVRASDWEETLGVAMQGAGLIDGGLGALKKVGEERQTEHFAGVDDQFQQELAAGKQDVEKTSTSTAMAILAKTRSSFGSNTRALLQARRILKRKQVFLFLRDLYTNIVTDHKEESWLREAAEEDGESDDGSSNSGEEDIVLDEDDEDLRIHAPREVRERLDDTHKPQGLTIIKVLGHFAEYVHFAQMALMSIKVLGVMVRAALRVKSNAHSITARSDAQPKRTTNIEQAMLTNNFISSALRALYRHPTDPTITRETLLLMIYMVNEEAEHNEHAQAKLQLLQPPERPFTLLLTISKLSSLDDRSNLLLCLQVFVTISTFPVPIIPSSPPSPPSPPSPEPPSPRVSAKRRNSRRGSRRSSKIKVQTGVRLAPAREPEAAQILVAVLEAHWRDQAIFKLVLKILTISCEQTQLCRCFFEAGLSSGLRRFFRKVRRGEVEECWFEDMKGRIGMSSKSLRKAKDAILARMRVTQAIREVEDGCWQMLQALAVNAGGGPQQAEQAHENYHKDTSKTIAQALHELRETPHGSQWPLAVKYLEAMLLYDFTGHAEFFQQQEGLTLTLAELPTGQVAAVHPLLVAVLRLHVRSIPTAPHYCPVADDQEEPVHRCDSYPRPMDLESKPMFPRLKQFSKRCSAPQLTIEGELVMHSDKVTNDAKATFAEAGAVKVLLESLLDVRDLDLQDGLLRILSDLVQDPALQAKQAAEEFKDFVLTDNSGADVVLELMKGNLKNKTRVNAALYTLAGVVTLIPDAASAMATELGSKVLIQTVWKYWSCGDTRRRSLMLLRRMRDAKPDLTAFMLKHWKASLAAMECGQSEDPDAATPEGTPEPVVEATPEVAQEEAGDERDDRDGNAVGDEGIGAVEEAEGAPEDQLEQMPLESCEMSQLDEETLEAVQPEEGRGPQTRESVTASPEPEAAPGNKLMTEAQLPREMRHFLALLKVHRFEQKSHILAIPDVVKAIVDFKDDPELSRLGMRALMSGTAMEQEMRLPTIGRCPNFVKSVRRIMHKESMQEVLQLQLRLVLGILDNDPSDYQDWVECAVFATVKVLQATVVWTTNSWEVILQAIEEAICTPQGKILLQNFNVALSLYKEWEKLKDSHDDALAKMIVSSFHDQTERILEIIG